VLSVEYREAGFSKPKSAIPDSFMSLFVFVGLDNGFHADQFFTLVEIDQAYTLG
jgi:hypothetical protein